MPYPLSQFLASLSSHPSLSISLLMITGFCLGSFINVVIYRLPIMMQGATKGKFNLMTPGSSCPHCNVLIRPWHNVPLLSFLALRGKCATCKSPISIRYPLIELSSGLILVWLNYYFQPWILAISIYCFLMLLITLTLIDWDTQLLPNSLTFTLIGTGLVVNYSELVTDFESSCIGAIGGYLILWSIYWIFKLITKKEGMGYGDFKLLSGIGAWLGWQALLPTIIISSFAGSVVGLGLIHFKKQNSNKPIAFGPFLSLGAVIFLFTGHELISFYLNLY